MNFWGLIDDDEDISEFFHDARSKSLLSKLQRIGEIGRAIGRWLRLL